MELRPGYKQTDIGAIPEGWQLVTAEEACDLVVDCKNRTPPVVVDSEYAVVRTPNVRDGQFVVEGLRYTDETSYREWTARAVPGLGDIMITREAPLGEVCAVPKGRKVCLGQRMMLYRPTPAKTDSTYLLYSLMSAPVRANLLKKIGGSTVGHAKVDDIRFLQLPLPPLPEQQAIATTLSDVDALITKLDQLIAKKRDLKQAAMQQLLTGKTRLPGFKGEWVLRRVGEIFRFMRTANNSRADLGPDGDVGYVHYGDIHTGSSVFLDCGDASVPCIAEERVASATAIEDGDLIMADASEDYDGIGKCVEACNTRGRKTVAGLHTFLLRASPEVLADGFKAYVQFMPAMRQALIRLATGVSVYGISKTGVKEIELHLPHVTEQRAIAAVLTDMDTELTGLEARRDKTRALKQGMMQELLTGRTRLV